MGYGLDGWILIPGRAKRFICTLQSSDWLWGMLRLQSSGNEAEFLREKEIWSRS
jgi:hypothetical protein